MIYLFFIIFYIFRRENTFNDEIFSNIFYINIIISEKKKIILFLKKRNKK